MTLMIFGMILPWLLVALGGWFCYQLISQNGRILLRLEELEAQMKKLSGTPARASDPRPQLPVGSTAPEIELPDLEGNPRTLAQFRGQRVLLIFSSPTCGYCVKMLPDLAKLPIDGRKGSPIPVVVTTGDAEANREHFEKHGIRGPVMLQKQMEVASQYMVNGTPMGYLVDEEGNIASELAVGSKALMTLASAHLTAPRKTSSQNGTKQNGAKQNGHGKANKGLDQSAINRDGLKAGTPAPAFRLPRVDGGELSLNEYRGRRTLLVFSDPECSPCDRLAPELERLHRDQNDVAILMVSRRDLEANRRKIAEMRLTFPVALQKNWEISKLYGMFATPIAYLIDEQGIIVSDVAKGVDPILSLIPAADAARDAGPVSRHATASA